MGICSSKDKKSTPFGKNLSELPQNHVYDSGEISNLFRNTVNHRVTNFQTPKIDRHATSIVFTPNEKSHKID